MRTKTLLLSAAVGAVGLLAADAQVYSVNSVGYVNKALATPGFHMISNPLKAATDNLNDIIPNAPEGSLIYTFTGGAFSPTVPEYFTGVGWSPNSAIAPGEGVFIYVPSPATLTFVGEVRQGAALTTAIPSGFSIRGSQVPQQATLSALGVPGGDGDLVYTWDGAGQGYSATVPEFFTGVGWSPDATVGVADGFFVFAQAPRTWTRNFSVNN